mmetsp:Transcript_20116/g.60215  ORF Transcript_20116/g.60215 Transcript_20116/m.60215 type:complete len:331 (+) Transcript_20116:170-1162(+)
MPSVMTVILVFLSSPICNVAADLLQPSSWSFCMTKRSTCSMSSESSPSPITLPTFSFAFETLRSTIGSGTWQAGFLLLNENPPPPSRTSFALSVSHSPIPPKQRSAMKLTEAEAHRVEPSLDFSWLIWTSRVSWVALNPDSFETASSPQEPADSPSNGPQNWSGVFRLSKVSNACDNRESFPFTVFWMVAFSVNISRAFAEAFAVKFGFDNSRHICTVKFATRLKAMPTGILSTTKVVMTSLRLSASPVQWVRCNKMGPNFPPTNLQKAGGAILTSSVVPRQIQAMPAFASTSSWTNLPGWCAARAPAESPAVIWARSSYDTGTRSRPYM